MEVSTPNALVAASFFFLLHVCAGRFPANLSGSRLCGSFWPDCSFHERDIVSFLLNLEYLEAEFFLCSALGHGLDVEAPELTMGGPPPVGCEKAKLSKLWKDIFTQMAYEEVGHLRAIHETLKNYTCSHGFARPPLNLSSTVFANISNNAFGMTLTPEFDPYSDKLSYLVASYVIPYLGITGYVEAMPCLPSPWFRKLAAGLLAIESGQDAIIRTLLYQNLDNNVSTYGFTVAQFAEKISEFRNKLGGKGVKDEGLSVDKSQGAEGKIKGNVLAGDENSVAYSRTPEEILAILYGTGDASKPGGFLYAGGNGLIAKTYLKK